MEALSCRLLPWEVADGPANMAADEVFVRGAAELGMPLDKVIAGVVAALQADAERLELVGNAELRPTNRV